MSSIYWKFVNDSILKACLSSWAHVYPSSKDLFGPVSGAVSASVAQPQWKTEGAGEGNPSAGPSLLPGVSL